VIDAAAAQRAVQVAVDEFGRLDVVVNNAGYANSSPIEETSDEDSRAQIETNLFGVVNVTKAALPILHAQRSGHFIQFSSIGGRVGGTPGIAAYQTAKFAVEGFSEVLANEVKPFGVRVAIIEPGAFRTDWQGSSMRRAHVGPDYESTVGEMNRRREASDGKQAGNPGTRRGSSSTSCAPKTRRDGCFWAPGRSRRRRVPRRRVPPRQADGRRSVARRTSRRRCSRKRRPPASRESLRDRCGRA
jgi:NAD(P)-dependent dehydrogenase (short-subunit alcohol dehydrogenase family)